MGIPALISVASCCVTRVTQQKIAERIKKGIFSQTNGKRLFNSGSLVFRSNRFRGQTSRRSRTKGRAPSMGLLMRPRAKRKSDKTQYREARNMRRGRDPQDSSCWLGAL